MPTKPETRQRQIDAVKKALTNHDFFRDGRIGYALSLKGVTNGRYGWNHAEYQLAKRKDGTLTDAARAWIEAAGMKDLADAFDRRALTKYATTNLASLTKRRNTTKQELDEIDREISYYQQLLSQAEEDTHESTD